MEKAATYLDEWTKKILGIPAEAALRREAIEAWQLSHLQETVRLAWDRSRFYRERLAGAGIGFDPNAGGGAPIPKSFADFARLPFTTPEDLRERGGEMLCVPQSEISRIVTLSTSGTQGKPKRIYFTEADQELTIDYFQHGMQNLTDKNDKVLILMPCRRPGSIGDLLRIGLTRLGAEAIAYGPPEGAASFAAALKLAGDEGVASLVAAPSQARQLLTACRRQAGPAAARPLPALRSVLLSAEYVPSALVHALEDAWGCTVFEHYGMTEMGLGCAVSCAAAPSGAGYHVRETDLYIEIIDPKTEKPAPDGVFGEVVFTTLTRRGMPLIRYRTGDSSRRLPGRCGCGGILKRLDKVSDRGLKKGGY